MSIVRLKPIQYAGKCKECGKRFKTKNSRKLFCEYSCAHRFHSREEQRRLRHGNGR